ncbi:hypothetical protein CR983_04325 [Candidatus Saccharibacteria bacterium]|nr:MAG: hypothetical protein CR983_04325 [Candidatus Saccharibacteria bacterium]
MKPRFFGKARARKASLRYNHPSRGVRLILVAGEYGKTTTARYLAEVLRESGEKVAVFTNLGSDIEGSPYEAAYDTSADAIQCAIAKSRKSASTVIMEVTPAFERAQTFETLQVEMVIATDDSARVHTVMEHPTAYLVAPHTAHIKTRSIVPHQQITYGEESDAEAHIGAITLYRGGTEVEMTIDHQNNVMLSTYLLGKANAYNVAAAIAAAYLLGCDRDVFEEGIARLEHIPGNLERVSSSRPFQIHLDRAPHARSIDLISESCKQLAKRRLLAACDSSIDEDSLVLLSDRCDRVTATTGNETHGRYVASSADEAAELTLRAARKDDMVLLLGPAFTHLEDGIAHGAALANGEEESA